MEEGTEGRTHGSIFVLLKRFIEKENDYSTWVKLKEKAGIERVPYEMSGMYHTGELFAIVSTVAEASKVSVNYLFEKFGEFLVPDLLLI